MRSESAEPGTGLHPLRGQNNVQGASDAGLIPMFYPDYADVTNNLVHKKYEELLEEHPCLRKNRAHRGRDRQSGERGRSQRGCTSIDINPAMLDPDLDHARAGLTKLEHMVVQDIFLTETAMSQTSCCPPPHGRKNQAP